MLVARRDPPFHTGAHDAAPPNLGDFPSAKAPKLVRFVTVVQMVGSLLALPVAIASGYSFYRTNFSSETTCQSLRTGIVAMLDKSVDAATRRILVRHDVETFEKTCGSVDPDATAAFKALLSVEKTAAREVSPIAATPKAQRVETAPKEAVRKVEPQPQSVAKQPVTIATPVVAEPVRREPGVSDTQWLDAVRQALATHKPEQPTSPKTEVPTTAAIANPQPATIPVMRAVPHEKQLSTPLDITSAPAAPVAAPALPPAIAVVPTPPLHVNADHPVPPGSIPDAMPPANDETQSAKADAAQPEEQGRSRVSKWISAIPLLGPVVDNARH